jgi:hypothetical protein
VAARKEMAETEEEGVEKFHSVYAFLVVAFFPFAFLFFANNSPALA